MPGCSSRVLCGYGTSFEAQTWLSWDPCGCFGIALSWGVHLYALVVLFFKVIPGHWIGQVLFYVLYLPCSFLAMASLFQASTIDPGAVPLGARPFTTVRRAASGELLETARSRRSIRRCHKCGDNYKPARAHHDSVTGRCVVKFDHFCPWVNNAVGALNHKFFCLFLLYTALSCAVALLLLLIRLIHCGYNVKDGQDTVQHSVKASDYTSHVADEEIATTGNNGHHLRWLLSTAVERDSAARSSGGGSIFVHPECADFSGSHLVIGLAVASLVFLIFSSAMGLEQLDAIETGKGKIARMKVAVGQSGGTEFSRVTEEFNEMFGGDSPRVAWHWLLPIPVKFPRGMKQVVLGYEWNETCQPVPYREPDDDGGDDDLEAGNALSPPKPDPEHVFSREASSVSVDNQGVKNRGRRTPPEEDADEGISLVERTRARLE